MAKDKNNIWVFVLLLSMTAFIIAGTAAYFSVFGLSKLFAGAGISAIILFGALEFGKLVSVSVLYRFWSKFSIPIRTIFTAMVIGIMFITSMGIYGFLRNAYDATSNEYNSTQNEIKILDQKKGFLKLEISRLEKDVDSKNNQINTYINNRTLQEQLKADLYVKGSDTALTRGERWVYRNRAKDVQDNITETDKQITELRNKNTEYYNKISTLNDSISSMDRQIMELEGSDVSVDIGPLKYLSDLTGYDMDNVVGGLIFLIIFVFDPFAIILIIAANRLSMVNVDDKGTLPKDIRIEDDNDDVNADIHNDIEEIKERIDSISTSNITDEQVKSIVDDIKNSMKEDLSEHVDIIYNKMNEKNKKDILNVVNTIKTDFDQRLRKLEEAISKNDVSEITIPGRYSHRIAARRPATKSKN